jgi:cytochrome bd-type quinol oxidase subunit 2
MRSSSPKRTHIIGRAELNSQTLVVIRILFELIVVESNVNTGDRRRQFVGSSFDCFTPFSIFTGVALMFGYALLGAGWLVIKTEGALQDWARALGRRCLIAVTLAVVIVSLWTPFSDAHIAARWFSWPNIGLLAPVPLITAGLVW